LVSPPLELATLKKASKSMGFSMNDVLLASVMQTIGELGNKEDQGHYL
jgi:hypothetical protein